MSARNVVCLISLILLILGIIHTCIQTKNITIIELAPGKIQANGGHAYTYVLKEKPTGWPITTLNPMQWLFTNASAVHFYCAGQEMGPGNSLHQDIRDYGGGRYSLWGDVLYFSTPENSDPQLASRSYELRIKPSLSYVGAAGAAFLLGVFIWASGLLISAIKAGHSLKRFCDRHATATCFLLALLLLATLLSALYLSWTYGKSSGLALATYYPISDAAVYWIGAHDLLTLIAHKTCITPALEYSQNRIIYPTLLSGISLVCKGSISAVLVTQAILFSLAVLLLLRSCRRVLGWAGCCSIAAFLGVYVSRHLLGQTMTENAGFIFGVSGVAFLIDYSFKKKWLDLLIGFSLLSIGLSSRAGAVLVLPALFLWAILYLPQRSPKKILITAAVAALAFSSGFVLQKGINSALGGNPQSYGNFSYVLYGLAHGGKSWTYVKSQFHTEAFASCKTVSEVNQKIYSLAFSQIRDHPLQLLEGFKKNLGMIASRGPSSLFDGQLPAIGMIVLSFALIGFGRCLLEWRNTVSGLMIFAAVGIFVSSLFIIGDGGERLFAATVGFDAIIIAMGISTLSGIIARAALRTQAWSLTSEAHVQHSAATSRAYLYEARYLYPILLAGVMVLPFTPLSRSIVERMPRIDNADHDFLTIDTTLQDPGTAIIAIGPTLGFRRDCYSLATIEAGLPLSAWYRQDLLKLDDKLLIQMPVHVRRNARNSSMLWLVGEASLFDKVGRNLRLRISTRETLYFGNVYLKIRSVELLD